MKINGMILLVALALFASLTAFGQSPPPNDNYANRTVLTGTDITFSGTLAGATFEDTNEIGTFDPAFSRPLSNPSSYNSIWWTWTAPVSTSLTLQVLSDDQYPYTNGAELIVYAATNGAITPASLVLPALASMHVVPYFAPQTLSLPVTAGSNYQIQIVGHSTANYSLRLFATNVPVIVQQPVNETVYSNASVVFYVVYAGTNQSAFTFQWRFNDTSLPDETAPMIALTNLDSSMAGAYSVIVSNAAGSVISQPAILTVSQSNYPATLAVTGFRSNALTFALNGENGRGYRLVSSTDLVVWHPELNFPENLPIIPVMT